MLDKIKQTATYIREKTDFDPEFGIVLGSGLGGLVKEIETLHALEYSSIPNFPVSTVIGHGGKLILGNLGGKKVIALQGRFHFYEGYSMQEVTFPIRVFKELGISKLMLSNAAGGMNPEFQVGDIVFIRDHINLMPSNPLIGKNFEELGPRFPDMSEPYDPQMISMARKVAVKHQFRSHTGVYAAVSGPCYETPAEYRYIRSIGADLVGMSTVPEVIAARHGGIPCFAVSIVTDLGGFETVLKVSHDEVLEVAIAAEKKLTTLIRELLMQL